MNTRDLFGLVVRGVGLVFLYHLLQQLPMMVPQLIGDVFGLHLTSALGALLFIGWHLLIAWWFLRGAPLLMRTAYGR